MQDFGLSYVSYMLFGQHQASGELVYDTGSGYLTVAMSEC
jgi:hypothetical protein